MKRISVPLDIVRPDYSVVMYTEQIYKVIRFKASGCRDLALPRKPSEHYDTKLDSSLSRSRRVILELALCNPWDWFCTFTISPEKADRFDLNGWYKGFTQWLRDNRKKGLEIAYLFVPERHGDGAWHMHGLLRGNMELVSFAEERKQGLSVPDFLVDGGYYDWPAYRERFGFCSLGRIHNPVATAFYCQKYVTKEQNRMVTELGSKCYRASQGLNRSVPRGDVYGSCAYLDQFLTHHYDFCSVGMTKLADGCDWSFALEYLDDEAVASFGESFDPLDDSPDEEALRWEAMEAELQYSFL